MCDKVGESLSPVNHAIHVKVARPKTAAQKPKTNEAMHSSRGSSHSSQTSLSSGSSAAATPDEKFTGKWQQSHFSLEFPSPLPRSGLSTESSTESVHSSFLTAGGGEDMKELAKTTAAAGTSAQPPVTLFSGLKVPEVSLSSPDPPGSATTSHYLPYPSFVGSSFTAGNVSDATDQPLYFRTVKTPALNRVPQSTSTARRDTDHRTHKCMKILSQGETIPGNMHALLYKLTLEGNNVVALVPENPELMPAGTMCSFLKDSPTNNKEFVWEKGILVLSFADEEAVKCVSAKLSPDRKSLLVEVPVVDR